MYHRFLHVLLLNLAGRKNHACAGEDARPALRSSGARRCNMPDLNRVTLRRVLLLAFALLSLAVIGAGQDEVEAHDQKHGMRRSIFETEHSCKALRGGLRTQDLTVLDLKVGASTIRDVQKRFPGTSPVKLTQEGESEEGFASRINRGSLPYSLRGSWVRQTR